MVGLAIFDALLEFGVAKTRGDVVGQERFLANKGSGVGGGVDGHDGGDWKPGFDGGESRSLGDSVSERKGKEEEPREERWSRKEEELK